MSGSSYYIIFYTLYYHCLPVSCLECCVCNTNFNEYVHNNETVDIIARLFYLKKFRFDIIYMKNRMMILFCAWKNRVLQNYY
jgi:hypothetical protein